MEKKEAMDKVFFAMQKVRNERIFQEMKNINDFMKQKGISGVFVKGLTLAYDLYETPDKRIFEDIDFFVQQKDLAVFNEYLSEKGYLHDWGEKVSPNGGIFKNYIPIHLPAFIKEDIVLEVHIMPYFTNSFTNMTLEEEAYNEFFSDITYITIKGEEFPVLKPNNNALFLLDHFIKHITYYLKHYASSGNLDLHLDVEKLDEARKYIQSKGVTFENLLPIAKRYNSVPVLVTAFKYLDELFENEEWISEKERFDILIKEYVNKYPIFENKLLGRLYSVSLKDIIDNCENKKFFSDIISSLPYTPAQRLKVPYKHKSSCGTVFWIDPKNPTNKFNSHWIQKNLDFKEYDFLIRNTVFADEGGLSFHSIIRDDSLAYNESNLLIFRFINEHKNPYEPETLYVRMNYPEGDKNNIRYHFVRGSSEEYQLDKISCINLDDKHYSVFVTIPWEMVGIEPEIGNSVKFEMIVYGTKRDTIWDIWGYGSVDRVCDPLSFTLLELTEEQ